MMTQPLARLTLPLLALFAVVAFGADLNQAKQDGFVGERADGYLGLVVASAPADVTALVTDINAKRKAQYQRIAKTNGLTMDQVQALAGKKALEKTRAGDWILINGGWQQK
jgi:uncharacterized protein YdbL (DUF1318 family)